MARDLVDIMGGKRGRPPERIAADDIVEGEVERVKLIDLEMVEHHRTRDAVLVSDKGEEAKAVWLPLSQIEIHREGKSSQAVNRNGQTSSRPVVTVTVPDWLAKEKGLV